MPQMRVCGRYTALSSDDFVTAGSCNAAWRTLVGTVLAVVVAVDAVAGPSTSACSTPVRVLLWLALGLSVTGIVVDVTLAAHSARGTIPNAVPRAWVPCLFLAHIGTVLAMTGVALGGVIAIFTVPTSACSEVLQEGQTLWALLVTFCVVTLAHVVGEWVVLGPLLALAGTGRAGGTGGQGLDSNAIKWQGRCAGCTRCLCRRTSAVGSGPGAAEGMSTVDTLTAVGRVMAATLAPVEGEHLTLSDVVAGMLLLRSVQKHLEATGALEGVLAGGVDAPLPSPPQASGAPAEGLPGPSDVTPSATSSARWVSDQVLPRSALLRFTSGHVWGDGRAQAHAKATTGSSAAATAAVCQPVTHARHFLRTTVLCAAGPVPRNSCSVSAAAAAQLPAAGARNGWLTATGA